MKIWIPVTIARPKTKPGVWEIHTVKGYRDDTCYVDRAIYTEDGKWLSVGGRKLSDLRDFCFAVESEDLEKC